MEELGLIPFLSAFNKNVLTSESDDVLDEMLHAWLAKRPPDDREGLHVSDFADPCFRRLMYKVIEPNVRDPAPEYKAQKFFDAGKAIHSWFQNEYFGPMGVLKGNWKCTRCGRVETGYMPTQPCAGSVKVTGPFDGSISCATAGSTWQYQEMKVSFSLEGFDVVGSTDGIITVRGTDRVLDMKSKDTELFKDLVKPEPKHVVQVSTYATYLGIPTITIMYIEKNKWEFKTYTQDVALWALDGVRTAAKTLRTLVDGGDPMRVSPKCPHKNVVRAKRCAYRSTCFPK